MFIKYKTSDLTGMYIAINLPVEDNTLLLRCKPLYTQTTYMSMAALCTQQMSWVRHSVSSGKGLRSTMLGCAVKASTS